MKILINKNIFISKKFLHFFLILFFSFSFVTKSFATWNYSTGVLTSTGATESSPDSLLAGIAIVQAADGTKGYRNGSIAWLNNVEVRAGESFILIDADSQIDLRGGSFINPQNGGVIHDFRSTLIISVTTQRIDGTLDFKTGSSLIVRKEKPNDPSPKILYQTNSRFDYPTILRDSIPAKISIDGLDFYQTISNSNSRRLFFGLATVSSVSNFRLFNIPGVFANSIYSDMYIESLQLASDDFLNGTSTFNRPTFYTQSPSSFSGTHNYQSYILNNPTFLNNSWNGSISINGSPKSSSKFSIFYTFTNIIKDGLTNLSGVNIQFTRSRQSVSGNPVWTAPNSTITATTNGSGTYSAVNLLDTYREGTSLTDLERFNWTLKARKYDKKTAGENVFTNRVLYQHSINMSAGYNEEVQMLNVPYLTLTETQALALTGISFATTSATVGTVTISEARTVAELWQYYRAWISQTANFGSDDTWGYDGEKLDIGAWNIVITSGGNLTSGKLNTTGAVTVQSGGSTNINYLDQNGDSILTLGGVDATSIVEVFNSSGTLIASSTGMTSYRYLSSPSNYIRIKVTQTDGSFLEQNYYLLAGENTLSFAFGGTVFTSQDRATLNTILSIVNAIWGKVASLPNRIASYFDVVQIIK
jgi:hypothetical protein